MSDTRPFPIQGNLRSEGGAAACSIPWWLAEAAFRQYVKHYGTDQTIDRMAERGGFGREELLDLLAGGNGMGRAIAAQRASRGDSQ